MKPSCDACLLIAAGAKLRKESGENHQRWCAYWRPEGPEEKVAPPPKRQRVQTELTPEEALLALSKGERIVEAQEKKVALKSAERPPPRVPERNAPMHPSARVNMRRRMPSAVADPPSRPTTSSSTTDSATATGPAPAPVAAPVAAPAAVGQLHRPPAFVRKPVGPPKLPRPIYGEEGDAAYLQPPAQMFPPTYHGMYPPGMMPMHPGYPGMHPGMHPPPGGPGGGQMMMMPMWVPGSSEPDPGSRPYGMKPKEREKQPYGKAPFKWRVRNIL